MVDFFVLKRFKVSTSAANTYPRESRYVVMKEFGLTDRIDYGFRDLFLNDSVSAPSGTPKLRTTSGEAMHEAMWRARPQGRACRGRHSKETWLDKLSLPRGSNVVPLWAVYCNPYKKKIAKKNYIGPSGKTS